MNKVKPEKFSAVIEIIGINPFVYLPEPVLEAIFVQANRNKGKIPVKIKIEGYEFHQTLIRYSGHWRLYLNTPMRQLAKKEAGDLANFEISFNPEVKVLPVPAKLTEALNKNKQAQAVFNQLAPYLRLEIIKYLSFLKTEESLNRNIDKAVNFLLGKQRFIGRDKP